MYAILSTYTHISLRDKTIYIYILHNTYCCPVSSSQEVQMSHEYASEYPSSLPFKQSYKHFFENFYKISDTPDAHDEYVDQFMPEATVIMASKRCEGASGTYLSSTTSALHVNLDALHSSQTYQSAEILPFRHSLWTKVQSRRHAAIKAFPFGPNSSEVMLYGTVAYAMKEDGRNVSVDWAARASLVEDNAGKVRMQFYQVYMVRLCRHFSFSI